MGWLSGIAGLWKIKWVPYAILLWGISVGGVSLWSYMKGKAVVEKEMAHQIAQALASQIEELRRVHDADLTTVVHTLAAEQELTHDIEDIQFPKIDPDCEHVLHDWMRSFNAAVSAVPSDPP